MNPQQAPRIVSKSRYLRYLSQKVALRGSAITLLIFGYIGVTFGGIALIICIVCLLCGINSVAGLKFWSLLGGLSLLAARIGLRQANKAERMEPVVPLTRQTVEQLSAEQSLVRASSEPSETQQAVLLRAAGSDTQTPPEELLRASTQEDQHEGESVG